VEPGNPLTAIYMALKIIKNTETHSEYVMFIAFLLRQRLHESASLLLYTYMAFTVFCLLLM